MALQSRFFDFLVKNRKSKLHSLKINIVAQNFRKIVRNQFRTISLKLRNLNKTRLDPFASQWSVFRKKLRTIEAFSCILFLCK